MATDKIEIVIDAKVGQALKGIGQVKKEAGDLAQPGLFSKIKTNWLGVTAAIGGVTAATAGLVNGIKASLAAFAEDERAQKTLAAAMKQAGTYTEEAFQHNLKYATSLQKLTTYGDEAIVGVQKLLTNFGFQGKALDDLTKATLDLAAAKDMDLSSAADIVAKSVGGETNALSRYGVVIEGAAGSTERTAMAVKNLAVLFGGSAQAEAATFSGQIKQMQNAFGDLLEIVGGKLAPIFTKAAVALKGFFELRDPTTKAIDGIVKSSTEYDAINKKLEKSVGDLTLAEKLRLQILQETRNAEVKKELEALNKVYRDQSKEVVKSAEKLSKLEEAAAKREEIYLMQAEKGGGYNKQLEKEIIKLEEAATKEQERFEAASEARGKTIDELGQLLNQLELTDAQLSVLDEDLLKGAKNMSNLFKKQKKETVEYMDTGRAVVKDTLEEVVKDTEEAAEEVGPKWEEMFSKVANAMQEFQNFANSLAGSFVQIQKERIEEWKNDQLAALDEVSGIKEIAAEDERDRIRELEDERDRAITRGDEAAQKEAAKELNKVKTQSMYDKEKAKIEKEAAKKQASLEYRSNMFSAALAIPTSIATAFAGAVGGPTIKAIAAAAAGVAATANFAAVAATKPPAFATGGSFVTSGPQVIQVGDNSSGAERVSVEPLGGMRGASGNVYNFYGYDADGIRNKIMRTEGRGGFTS